MEEWRQIQDDLKRLLDLKRDNGEIRLISVGSSHSGEHHWKFRTASGQTITIKMEIEKP